MRVCSKSSHRGIQGSSSRDDEPESRPPPDTPAVPLMSLRGFGGRPSTEARMGRLCWLRAAHAGISGFTERSHPTRRLPPWRGALISLQFSGSGHLSVVRIFLVALYKLSLQSST